MITNIKIFVYFNENLYIFYSDFNNMSVYVFCKTEHSFSDIHVEGRIAICRRQMQKMYFLCLNKIFFRIIIRFINYGF